MIIPSPGSRAFSRRALPRISSIVVSRVSSTYTGAFVSASHALTSRGQSSFVSRPVRRRCSSTRPSEHISRWATSTLDISSVKTATGVPWWSARLDATPSANADLPMLGRPATTTRLPG